MRALLQEVLDDVYIHAKQEGVDLQVEIAGGANSQGRDAGEGSKRERDGSISEEEVAAVLVLGVIASTAALDKISCRSLSGTSPASAPLAPVSEQAGSNEASSPLPSSLHCPTASLGSTGHSIEELQQVS